VKGLSGSNTVRHIAHKKTVAAYRRQAVADNKRMSEQMMTRTVSG